MKKLKDFEGQKIAIHFPTYELWLRRKEINPSDDCEDFYWESYNEKICYFVDLREEGRYGNLSFAEKNDYIILPATDFLEEEFIYGQEYEFTDTKIHWVKRLFLVKAPCGKFVCYNKDSENAVSYKYARKINTERTEAITTAKELIAKFDIKQEELFND